MALSSLQVARYAGGMLLALALGCTPLPSDSAAPADTAAEDTGDSAAPLPEPAALVEPSAGACPDFGGGARVSFTAAGLERTARVYVPEGEGPFPVLFAWHPLGGSAKWMSDALELEAFSEEHGVIAIAPDASGEELFEWQFLGNSTGEADLAVYDDLRTCAVRELGGDIRRVSTMGFSAGALWSTYLSIHRGDTLATAMPWSGGTGDVVKYSTPAQPFPALLTHGGETDVYSSLVHFDQATIAFADSLVADGHFVVLCTHDEGHTFPPGYDTLLAEWVLPHEYGVPSPFADGDLGALPEGCAVYATGG